MKPLRIAFGCQARVGKDTACKFLQEKYGGNIYHFSDPLYQILHYAQDVCGFQRKKDAAFLQWVGTEWGRAQNKSVWIDATLNKIDPAQHCYIADLRFPNEIEKLREHGFICVRIVRDDRPVDRNTMHSSETALVDYKDWDAIITNNGNIADFYKSLCELFDP